MGYDKNVPNKEIKLLISTYLSQATYTGTMNTKQDMARMSVAV